jgi:hypothetical protein
MVSDALDLLEIRRVGMADAHMDEVLANGDDYNSASLEL